MKSFIIFADENPHNMKKLLFTIAFAFIGIFTAQAQWFIGGSASAAINKESQTFSIAPIAGYCFPDTPFSITCAIEYGGTFQSGEAYTHSLTVSPYGRYNICDIGERFSLFVDFGFDIDALELNFFDIMLFPGVAFELTEHWSAEFSIGLLGCEWERGPNDTFTHNFVLGFETAAPSFGFYYSF